ncbi:MAG: hypothetical protein PWP54_574 [Thermosipho sp. (in: thermotogales)]|nr:hypothetical protein [Thermosipho sp. (in: thermotogales)]
MDIINIDKTFKFVHQKGNRIDQLRLRRVLGKTLHNGRSGRTFRFLLVSRWKLGLQSLRRYN